VIVQSQQQLGFPRFRYIRRFSIAEHCCDETYPAASPVTPHAVEQLIRETWHHRHDMIRGG
jgi:hypothetical protein